MHIIFCLTLTLSKYSSFTFVSEYGLCIINTLLTYERCTFLLGSSKQLIRIAAAREVKLRITKLSEKRKLRDETK